MAANTRSSLLQTHRNKQEICMGNPAAGRIQDQLVTT